MSSTHRGKCYEYRDLSIMVFTELWLPHSVLKLEGFSLVWAENRLNRQKQRRGLVYLCEQQLVYKKQYKIRETICTPDLELLCISTRSFYLPREFGNIILCSTYIPPSGNATTASKNIAECVHSQLLHTPGAPVFTLGDFNANLN